MRLLLVEDSDRMRHLLGESIHDAGWRLGRSFRRYHGHYGTHGSRGDGRVE